MRGGDEPPCLRKIDLPEYEKERGRPCPYVDLEPANGRAAEMLSYLLDERLRPIAPWVFQMITQWMPPDERVTLVQRVAGALRDKAVMALLYPEREKANQG